MVPLRRNMHNFTLFYKKLIEGIKNVISAWGNFTRSVIRIGTNIGKKDETLNVLLGFTSIKTMEPYKWQSMPLKLTWHPWHQKIVHNSTGKKFFLIAWRAARRAAAHHTGAAGAVTASSHLPHPSDGVLVPPKQGHLVYLWISPEPYCCMSCQALILSASNAPPLPERPSPHPHS